MATHVRIVGIISQEADMGFHFAVEWLDAQERARNPLNFHGGELIPPPETVFIDLRNVAGRIVQHRLENVESALRLIFRQHHAAVVGSVPVEQVQVDIPPDIVKRVGDTFVSVAKV